MGEKWWEMDPALREEFMERAYNLERGISFMFPEGYEFVRQTAEVASATAAVLGRRDLSEPLKVVAPITNFHLLFSAYYQRVPLEEAIKFEGNGDKTSHLPSRILREFRRHVLRAVRSLELKGAPDEMIRAAMYHHERFDGSGYPQRVKGSEIPIEGAIMGATCYYVVNGRNEEVLENMRRSGKFSPEVVDAIEEAERTFLIFGTTCRLL